MGDTDEKGLENAELVGGSDVVMGDLVGVVAGDLLGINEERERGEQVKW